LLWRAASEAGLIRNVESNLVDRALALGERSIASCMTPRHDFEWINLNQPLCEIRDQVMLSRHSRFPVRAPDDIVPCIVSAKSILALPHSAEKTPETVLEPALFVQEKAGALRILNQFRRDNVEFALVLDEYGDLRGLVTTRDLYDALAGKPDIAPKDDLPDNDRMELSHEQIIDGSIPMDELRRLLHRPQLGLGDSRRYHTAAGFVLERLKYIPKPGSRFKYDGLLFEVREMAKLRVTRITIIPEQDRQTTAPNRELHEVTEFENHATL